jgi:tetratricopeptide (TPR) repeat protein/predicted Ser/Thr protein kinase
MSLEGVADEGSRHDSYVPPGPVLESIGPYRVLSLLGEGGMGVVYLAEQTEPVHREVALKVLRAGEHTREIVARFESERQALALMEHPNITRVYDAGATADGLPYFVMERVSGAPITEYAAAHCLTTRERLRLMMQVCRAVQHAHQKGIIHRDIKPSNVLVMESDGEPVCKIIDFGIAKATAPRPGWAKLTGTGMVIGTPAYMSPEQFDGDGVDIDTRSDIYSVGVLLYELIAGVLPFGAVQSGRRSLSGGELTGHVPAPSRQYAALEQSKRKALASERRSDPGALRRTMTGDLDCIILKALENERDQRYATANALALDLDRYLANEPVAARTPTAGYRAQKFVRRHRTGVAFAITLVMLLVAVAVGASAQARRLAVANASVQARQRQAENLIVFMLGDLRERLEPVGKLDVLDDVGRKALTYFAAVPESDLSTTERYHRAVAVRQLGSVRLAQGKLPEAQRLMRQSIELVTPLVAADSLNPQWQLALAHAEFYAGQVDMALGNIDSATSHFIPFVAISNGLLAHYPDSLAYKAEVAYALNNIGFAREAKGDATAGLASYQAAIALLTPLVQRDSTKTEWLLALGGVHNASGVARRKLGDLAGALEDHKSELVANERVARRDSTNRGWQRYLAITHTYLSDIRLWRGDAAGALAELRIARPTFTSLVHIDGTNAQWGLGLANNYRRTAQLLIEQRDPTSALRELDSATARLERLRAAGSAPNLVREGTAIAAARARALTQLGRRVEARVGTEEALAAAEAAMAQKPGDRELRKIAADCYLAYGDLINAPGRESGAATAWAHALTMADSLARSSRDTDILALQASAMLRLRGGAEAKPIVAELMQRGYRRPSFIELLRSNGITSS